MAWIVWILACAATVLSTVAADQDLLGLSASLALVLAGVFVMDAAALLRLCASSKPALCDRSHCLTGIARVLSDRIKELIYKTSLLAWQAETRGQHELIERGSKDFQSSALQGDHSANEEQLVASVVRAVQARFRSKAVVIVLKEEGQLCRFYSHGVHGERFRNYFLDRIKPHFQGKPVEVFGLRDGLASNSVLGEFSIFGFRYSICFPLAIEPGGALSRTTGVLWLGYSESQPPLDSEVERARALAARIENDVREIATMERLSDRVHEAESLNREKTEVIAHLSHDLRSPLGNIKAILSLFRLESAAGETQALIDTALKNCESVAEIVEDLLDYSRHSMGKLSAREELFCLRAIAEAVVEGFSVTARLKGLTLTFESDCERCIVRADRRHVARILSNIISNSLKYTLHGGVAVTVLADAHGQLSVRVSDSGVGMTAEQVQRLFTPFTRFQSEKVEGVGLGLALSKILTELNGGKIEAVSEVGKGSIFTVRFNQVRDVSMTAHQEVIPIKDKAAVAGCKALVVDDDVDCVETIGRVLVQHGCDVLKANHVQDALNLLNYELPDVIISDAHMPGGGVKRILERVRPLSKQIAVMVLSGSDLKSDNLAELGAASFMEKPADMRALLAWIESVVISRRLEDEGPCSKSVPPALRASA